MFTLLFLIFTSLVTAQKSDSTLVDLRIEIDTSSTDLLKTRAYNHMGEYYQNSNLDSALVYFKKALNVAENSEVDLTNQVARAQIAIGVMNGKKGNYPEATEYLLKARTIFMKTKDSVGLPGVTYNLGRLYIGQKQPEKAILFYRESYDISKSTDIDRRGHALNGIGASFNRMGQLDSALVYYRNATLLFKEVKNERLVHMAKNNIALIALKQKKYIKAEKLFLEVIKFHEEHGDKHSLSVNYYNLGNNYGLQKKHSLAQHYLDKSLAISLKEELKERSLKNYQRKSAFYEEIGSYQKAHETYKLYNQFQDSIYNLDNAKKIQKLELTYEFRQEKVKDSILMVAENERVTLVVKNEKTKKNLYLGFLLIAIIAAMGVVLLLRKNHRNKALLSEEKLQKEKAKKELLDQKLRTNEEETKRLIADNSMRLAFKQGLLDKIKNEIYLEEPENIKGSLRSLTMELQSQIATESKLSGIQHKIDEVNKGFDTKLRLLYPELTKTEREMCSLLRLNFSIKEIMTIRNTSIDSVKSIRYRIRKKMRLSKGEELEQFIQNIG